MKKLLTIIEDNWVNIGVATFAILLMALLVAH